MRERKFVFTWWAGTVRDCFGSRSVFRVARLGVLRIPGRRLASATGREAVGSTGAPPPPSGFVFPGLVCVPYLHVEGGQR